MGLTGLTRRASRLRLEVERWRTLKEHRPSALLLSVQHHNTFRDTIAKQLQEVDAELQSGDVSKIRTAMHNAERTWQLFRHLLDQRQDPDRGRLLQVADLSASDGYALVHQLAGRTPPTPPVTVIDAFDSFAIYGRGAVVDLPGMISHRDRSGPSAGGDAGWMRALQVPLVVLPPEELATPWRFVLIHHEVGHQLASDFDLVRRLAPALPTGWASRADEILADAFGAVLGGVAFEHALRDILEEVGMPGESDAYPASETRLAIVRGLTTGECSPDPTVKQTISALLGLAIGATNLRSIADAGPTEKTWRRVACESMLAASNGEQDGLIERFAQDAGALEPPAWAREDAAWALIQDALLSLEPTLRKGGKKDLPTALLRAHDMVAMVGASHHRIVPSFVQAAKLRNGSKWRVVEIYALTDAGLASIYGESVNTWIQERNEALAQLAELLPQVAESWSIRFYEHPFIFASYWDWGGPGGRIHVSHALWGQPNLTLTPSHDRLWSIPDACPKEFSDLVNALDALRSGSILFRDSGAER